SRRSEPNTRTLSAQNTSISGRCRSIPAPTRFSATSSPRRHWGCEGPARGAVVAAVPALHALLGWLPGLLHIGGNLFGELRVAPDLLRDFVVALDAQSFLLHGLDHLVTRLRLDLRRLFL